jgi:hypothetical protein
MLPGPFHAAMAQLAATLHHTAETSVVWAMRSVIPQAQQNGAGRAQRQCAADSRQAVRSGGNRISRKSATSSLSDNNLRQPPKEPRGKQQ